MTDNSRRFLICHRGSLGDFILAWPAIFLLRKNFPEYKFVGLGRRDYMKLAIKLAILDECHDAESATMLDFFETGIIPEVLGKPEKGVLWLKDSRKTADLLKKNSSCDYAAIEPFPKEKIHVAEYHLREILKYLKMKESFIPIDLIPEQGIPSKNIICIHPGSGSSKKNYSPEFYLEAAKFAEDHFKKDVKFILGPIEAEQGIGKLFPAAKILKPENTSELADTLGGAFLFIGNDSGVGHLAGFLGVPTIILYKNTDPETWGVIGRKTACLKNPVEETAWINLHDFLVSGNIF